jgi:D-psicose/D-tagatose/L-ribulose 3-epimerase
LDKNAYVQRSIKSLKEVVKTAEDNNVIFACEIVNRFEQFLLNTAAEGVDYAKQVDSPSLKIMLDTFHMNIEENSIAEAVATGGEYIGHVHIGENNRMPPGYGHIPWDELVVALKKINYQKAIVMEPFLKPGGEVGRDIRVWRDLGVGMDMDEEARKAVNFMRSKLLEVIV